MPLNQACFPVVLVILDGFGYGPNNKSNAITAAQMPFWQELTKNYPFALLEAAGEHVGLLPGSIGNSEVGHLTLGAGRVIPSILSQFDSIIQDRSFFENKLLNEKFTQLKKHNKTLHLMGLLSDGGVHSHEKHLYALIELAGSLGIKKVVVHAFLDGRDVAPQSADLYLQRCEERLKRFACGEIGSIQGRFYAMDRDNNWERTQAAYNMLCGKGNISVDGWEDALKSSYQNGVTDEFVQPVLLGDQYAVSPGDGLVFFNFRPDRARQLTECFIDPAFEQYDRIGLYGDDLAFFISTVCYNPAFTGWNNDILFKDKKIYHTLLDEVEQQLVSPQNKVVIVAETEKYAHVTYFFKGMRDEVFDNETRVLVPSLKAQNYIHHPEMSAKVITKHVLASLQTDPASFYLVNYANADMVGHSGNFQATVQACELLDQQIAQLYQEVVVKQGGTLFITADHGNAEHMIDMQTGDPVTAHTINPVPFVMVNEKVKGAVEKKRTKRLGLAHVAPTVLLAMGLHIPKEMTQETIF